MKAGIWLGAALVACVLYAVLSAASVEGSAGVALLSLVRPAIVPVGALVNAPAFAYCAALLIVLAGPAACAVYHVTVLRPSLLALRRVRVGANGLPEPRIAGSVAPQAWPEARQALGLLLHRHDTFVAAWAAFQAEATRGPGVPGRPFSSFVAAAPRETAEPDDALRSLPGRFILAGVTLTAVGLILTLYLFSKDYRAAGAAQDRIDIVELFIAASLKAITTAAALVSACLVTFYRAYGMAALRRERRRTATRIEDYVALWRERTGVAAPADAPAPADLLRRFDAVLAGVADLARDVRLLAERDAPPRPMAGTGQPAGSAARP